MGERWKEYVCASPSGNCHIIRIPMLLSSFATHRLSFQSTYSDLPISSLSTCKRGQSCMYEDMETYWWSFLIYSGYLLDSLQLGNQLNQRRWLVHRKNRIFKRISPISPIPPPSGMDYGDYLISNIHHEFHPFLSSSHWLCRWKVTLRFDILAASLPSNFFFPHSFWWEPFPCDNSQNTHRSLSVR